MYMRELTEAISEIRGVGPKRASALENIGINTVGDLFSHFPRTYEDRIKHTPFAQANERAVNTIAVVKSHNLIGRGRKKTLKIVVEDETGRASLMCFGRNFLAERLFIGQKIFLFGVFQQRYNELQCSSFEFEEFVEGSAPGNFGCLLPVYPLTADLSQGFFRKTIRALAQEKIKYIQEELPQSLHAKRGLMPYAGALRCVHMPSNTSELYKAIFTLKYHELLYLQIIIARRSILRQTWKKTACAITGKLAKKMHDKLPFELTDDQKTVLKEIREDMQQGRVMARLLQGDVGSGKTLVALTAALYAVENKNQAALMAPTELLARQHADNCGKLLEPVGVRVAYLTGNIKDKNRKYLLEALKNNEIDVIVGTHALFSRDVEYARLGLIIIDEQHRFGVAQRQALADKAQSPDLLLMTATPIPRTLAISMYGDLDVSLIKQSPSGRMPVKTHLARTDNASKVYERVRQELKAGRQAYFVYPLIEQTENMPLRDAISMYEKLKKEIYPEYNLDLLHSKVDDSEKKQIMGGFTAGEIDILVATSVVEVGVDVANAVCMVIEHSERFGLSALHQLRGRVGRGKHQSYAFLIYDGELSDEGIQRLKVMKEHNDGFVIAEEDLKQRGPGEVTGMAQSGFLRLKIADISRDQEVLQKAREDAFELIKSDPGLLSPENRQIREVLNRCPPFSRDTLFSG